MIDIVELRRKWEGVQLPPARFVVHGYEAFLVSDCLEAVATSVRSTHPLHVFLAAILGMSTSMQEIWAGMGSSAQEGPMFGELTVNQHRPILPEEMLEITGTFHAVHRKYGRSGTFDVLEFELYLTDTQGVRIGSVINSFVFPRERAASSKETT